MSNKKTSLGKLEKQMAGAGFWDNPETAQSVVSQLSALKSVIEPVEEIQREVEDLKELFELAAAESDEEELTELELNCLFILSHISSNSIFKKAGVELDETGNIKVDDEQKTNLKGVYAAGDCTGGLFQVVFATAEGARAAISACKYLRQLDKE